MDILTTQRLHLHPVTPAFLHELFRTKEKQDIVSRLQLDEDSYQKLKMMHDGGIETFSVSMFYFLLLDKETQTTVGECGFHTLYKRHHKAELFYIIHEPFRKMGLATEAVRAVLEFGFNELKLHRVAAFVADYNTPSVKLLQRLGFTKEGNMREDYLVGDKYEDSDGYSLLKWEWEKRNYTN